MLLRPNINLPMPDTDSLFPRQTADALRVKAEEELHSRLIISFEEAIALGMPPLEALSQVLSWVSLEIARIQASQFERGAPSAKAG